MPALLGKCVKAGEKENEQGGKKGKFNFGIQIFSFYDYAVLCVCMCV
jgi:hypothetical protein